VVALVRRADATAAGRDEVPPGTPARIAEFEVLRVASERAGAALAAREAAYRAIFETAAAGVAEVNAKARRYVRVNRRFCAIVGRTEAELLGGMGPHDLFHPEDRTLVPTYRAVAEGREIEDECRVVRPDGTIRWVRASASVSAFDASGRPERAVAVLQDITERRQAEEARALLAQEVDHRSKNALAVVRAAVRLTPRTDAEAYARAIEGRVTALARAHTLLADARWAGAELAALARAELEAFVAPPGEAAGSAPRAEIDGPPVTLASAASQGFAMVLHELATNATKHGALSAADGRVRLSWRRDEAEGVLRLRWEETGGPPVAHPTRLSFGSRVIESTIRGQLGGACGTTWTAGGIVFEAEVPLARAVSRDR
jgi:PAS domain S-box-containing protein